MSDDDNVVVDCDGLPHEFDFFGIRMPWAEAEEAISNVTLPNEFFGEICESFTNYDKKHTTAKMDHITSCL